MNINIKVLKQVTVVEMAGDVDANTTPIVTDQVLPLVLPQCRLLLDMTKVLYMSSAGLRMMLLLYRQASSQNGHLVLVGLSEEIQDIMSITGFLDFFTTCKTLDSGLKTLCAN
jgi:anti-sigma B factor antagonist